MSGTPTPTASPALQMKARCVDYRHMRTRIQREHQVWMQARKSNIAILNRFARESERLPPGVELAEINPQLAADAARVTLAAAAYHTRLEAQRDLLGATLVRGLAAIGAYHGALACKDGPPLPPALLEAWRQANSFRREHLDGIDLSSRTRDLDGPMFKAFAKAAGIKPVVLDKLLAQESLRAEATEYHGGMQPSC